MQVDAGRNRVVIEGVEPQVDCGRFPAKAVVGDRVEVEADAFTDGHDAIRVRLLHRRKGGRRWYESDMRPLGNDRWRGAFQVEELCRYQFTVEAWVDPFATWQRDMAKRVAAGQDLRIDLRIGAALVRPAADRARADNRSEEAELLDAAAELLDTAEGVLDRDGQPPARGGQDWLTLAAGAGLPNGTESSLVLPEHAARGVATAKSTGAASVTSTPDAPSGLPIPVALSAALAELMRRHPDRSHASRFERVLEVRTDRPRARFSSWYEFFPRSAGEAGEHGTFDDCVERLAYVASMGFDVVYLPPIHPIGETKRKGRNNAVVARDEDVGSPWAIGGAAGGHKAIHPALGTLRDFRRFRKEAEKRGLEIALDVAFQVSPDHPYVKKHPEWFRARPDGTVQYAENPPKKYEDIYPFDFDSDEWESLWHELKSVFDYWIEQGVRIFRVDNPHTKAFPFWEWCVAELEQEHPDVILLAEAFTRPRVMYRLAKLGYHQSYTYFAWRYSKHDFQEYLTELTSAPVRHFFRPNFWPNTPDILTEQLQTGGRPVFMQRLVLAATLSSNYGIYGPAFELVEARPREQGSEEYLDSEKYQLRDWDLDAPHSLKNFIARVNRIRRENPALQRTAPLRFHAVDNDMVMAYSKAAADAGIGTGTGAGTGAAGGANVILVVVNLDSYHRHGASVHLDLRALGIGEDEPFVVHDLLGGGRYHWRGASNYIELDPQVVPAHVFRIERRVRSEQDFDNFR